MFSPRLDTVHLLNLFVFATQALTVRVTVKLRRSTYFFSRCIPLGTPHMYYHVVPLYFQFVQYMLNDRWWISDLQRRWWMRERPRSLWRKRRMHQHCWIIQVWISNHNVDYINDFHAMLSRVKFCIFTKSWGGHTSTQNYIHYTGLGTGIP